MIWVKESDLVFRDLNSEVIFFFLGECGFRAEVIVFVKYMRDFLEIVGFFLGKYEVVFVVWCRFSLRF